jgi:hypothetical protein
MGPGALPVASYGVRGHSDNAIAVYGLSGSDFGVLGSSIGDVGVVGLSSDAAGVFGHGSTGLGGLGDAGPGVVAKSDFANLSLPATANRLAPTNDSVEHQPRDVVTDKNGGIWVCVAAGTPGTWRKVAGPDAAGALHLLPTPVRAYDSRPGSNPAVGSKTKLSGNAARSLSVRANSTGVPALATAVSVTLLLVNALTKGGNFTIWAGNTSRPSANAMVWGGTAGRFASTAITRISAAGTVWVAASAPTDLALDIVGYYV